MSRYSIPSEYYFPIHHIRPRFKDDLEGVLLYVADCIGNLGEMGKEAFDSELDAALRMYPGNATKVDKTIANWRTEISSLFTFVLHKGTNEAPSLRCKELSANRDLPEAFRKFLFTFQYPGGHLKPHVNLELITAGVKFKPVQYLLQILRYGNRTGGNIFGITKAEACHCVFNDLRVTRDGETIEKIVNRILDNRRSRLNYNEEGDVIRYAGDILDYMEIAGLVRCHDGKTFYLNLSEEKLIDKFISSTAWFDGYDSFYRNPKSYSSTTSLPLKSGKGTSIVSLIQDEWEAYVNRDFSGMDFAVNIVNLLGGDTDAAKELDELQHQSEELEKKPEQTIFKTKDIGERGEALVYGHECMRLKLDGRSDLIHLVKRIPTVLAMGFDISSIESDTEKKRYIEVKSTTSFKPIEFNSVTLTRNEWRTAETNRDRYFVYRLYICMKTGDSRLYLLQDPVGLYKSDKISMSPSPSGVQVRFDTTKVGSFEGLLKWKK